MTWLIVLNFAALLAVMAMLAYLFHKVRQVHLVTYELRRAAHESTHLFAQIQSLMSLERTLKLPRPLPAMRGWAGSPDFLNFVANEVLSRHPNVIVECSSGVSTLVIARGLQIRGAGHVFSLEHDAIYAAKTTRLLAEYGLSEWATVVHAPLVEQDDGPPWYDLRALPDTLTKIDMLVVDGPPARTGSQARSPALPRFAERLSTNALIIADDTNRDDETRMIQAWLTAFPDWSATRLDFEKGCVFLEKNSSPAQ